MRKHKVGDRVNINALHTRIPKAYWNDAEVIEVDRKNTSWPIRVRASNGSEDMFPPTDLVFVSKFKVGDRVDSINPEHNSVWKDLTVTYVDPEHDYCQVIATRRNGDKGGFLEEDLTLSAIEEKIEINPTAEEIAVDLRNALKDATKLRQQLIDQGYEVDETYWFDVDGDQTTPSFEILKRL